MIQTATETNGNGDIRKRILQAYTQPKRADICFACEFDDMFSSINTVRKAAWLKLTRLECESDREDSRESKMP